MKILVCALFAALIGSSPAYAAVEQCRLIKAKADREACYAQQNRELAAKRSTKTTAPVRTMDESVEQMKREDDILNRRLRSICRGC
jgi:hypothetical protein